MAVQDLKRQGKTQEKLKWTGEEVRIRPESMEPVGEKEVEWVSGSHASIR